MRATSFLNEKKKANPQDFTIKGTNSEFLNTLKSADLIQSVLRRRHIATNMTIINQNRVLRNVHM